MTNAKVLLWVDDDGGEDRFLFEEYNLKEEGWEVKWAYTVEQASELLTEQAFQAILLDQMLPPRLSDDPDEWGGCALLYWLRTGDLPPGAKGRGLEFLPDVKPLPNNRDINITLVSAFHDEEIQEAIRKVEKEDSPVELVAKPIDLNQLRACLNRAVIR